MTLYGDHHKPEVDPLVAWPWLSSISRAVDGLTTPSMVGSTLYVTSDYSGDQSDSKYQVISVLLADLELCYEWEIRRREVRAACLRDGRRMSFKNLNDKRRQQALAPFLCAAGSIPGLLVTFAIGKRIEWLVTTPNSLSVWSRLAHIKAEWCEREFEYMARIAFFTSFLASRVLKPHQDLIWISDQDQIFANPQREQDVARMAGAFADLFFQVPVGNLFLGTTEIDPGDRAEEDFAAIPDLVAGAVADILSVYPKLPLWPVTRDIPEGTKAKSDFILHWLVEAPKVLKHDLIAFASEESGKLRVGRVAFTRR